MRRVIVPGMCLGLMSVIGACATGQDPALMPTHERQSNTAQGPRDEPGDVDNPTAPRAGPLPDAGKASCGEQYSPEAVADRAFAFDGVVVEIGSAISNRGDHGDLDLAGVTFEVGEWFSGGSGTTVTVDMSPPVEESHGPSEGGPSYAIGSRLLVSGQPRWGGTPLSDAIAWGCDFTRYYDPATAKSWNEALSE